MGAIKIGIHAIAVIVRQGERLRGEIAYPQYGDKTRLDGRRERLCGRVRFSTGNRAVVEQFGNRAGARQNIELTAHGLTVVAEIRTACGENYHRQQQENSQEVHGWWKHGVTVILEHGNLSRGRGGT